MSLILNWKVTATEPISIITVLLVCRRYNVQCVNIHAFIEGLLSEEAATCLWSVLCNT